MLVAAAEPNVNKETGVLRGRDILCFSHDWSGDPLSKTHLMRILAHENRILWVNAIANRMPTAAKKDVARIFRKLAAFAEPVKEVEPNLFVLNPLAIPAYGNAAIRGFNQRFLRSQVLKSMRRLRFRRPINMVFNPAAGLLAGKLGEETTVYYCVDEYTAFTGVSSGLKQIEDSLFRTADLVVVSAEKLLESKKALNANTHLIRHGTDWKHFRRAIEPETQIPAGIADLPRPVIGFHGLLADWVDYELIRKTAERYSSGSVVLIGKIAVDAEEKIKVLNGAENIHLLGRKPYADLPAYCKGFDVAINPFVINELTLAANPLKVREYLAAGLTVVSTDIPEVRILGNCLVAASHTDFLEKIETVLSSARSRDEISDSVRHESWEAKIEELRGLIERTEGKKE